MSYSPSFYDPKWFETGAGAAVGNGGSSQGAGGFDWRRMAMGAGAGIGSIIGGGMFNGSGQMQGGIGQGIDAAKQYLDQGNSYLDPYRQGGQQAYGQYQDWLNRMQNPNGFYNDVMSQYQMTPAAQFQLEQGTQAANRSAAAGGNVGTPAAQKQLMQYSQGITAQDQQRYLENIMGINSQYGAGVNNLNQMGFGAAGQMNQNRMSMADILAQLYQNQGMAGAYGQQSMGGGIGGLLGGIAGSMMGGPFGGALGGSLFG